MKGPQPQQHEIEHDSGVTTDVGSNTGRSDQAFPVSEINQDDDCRTMASAITTAAGLALDPHVGDGENQDEVEDEKVKQVERNDSVATATDTTDGRGAKGISEAAAAPNSFPQTNTDRNTDSFLEEIVSSIQSMPAITNPTSEPPLPGAYARTGGIAQPPGNLSQSGVHQQEGSIASQRDNMESQGEDVDSDLGLVEAKPVEQDISVDLEQAQPVYEDLVSSSISGTWDQRKKKASTRRMIAGSVLIVFVVFLLSFTLPRPTDNSIPANGPNTSSTENASDVNWSDTDDSLLVRHFAYLRDLLPNDLIPPNGSNGYYPSATLNPQDNAFYWLAKDPRLETYSKERAVQRLALATLYHSTEGDNWKENKHWLDYNIHECDWYHGDRMIAFFEMETSDYPCNNETGLYERLWLPNNNLNGTLPDAIYAMSSLLSMEWIWNGNLKGTISPEISRLQNLEKVSFTFCHPTGTIPTEIGLVSSLRILYVTTEENDGGKLQGTIPEEIDQLSNLEQLNFGFQTITGTLPTTIGLLTRMKSLGAQDALLTGSLPSELGLLSDMVYIYVYGNHMSGEIPSELGILSNLVSLNAHNNQFNGRIPSELGLATSLTEILLSNNTLQGTIPSELGLLSNVKMVYLSHNKDINGTLPEELNAWNSTIQAFDISHTDITGRILPFLEQAQNKTSFERYFFECDQRFPCINDRPDDSRTPYERDPEE